MDTVAALERSVAAALVRAEYSGNGCALVLGVSGGPDSSALLHSLHRLSSRHRLRLHVAHLVHDLRGQEADEDARFVESLAADLGLAATVERADVPEYQRRRRVSSFEQAAREVRYAFLARVAGTVGAAAVAVGHTADDLAETVLLNILRGTGLHGLRGMSEVAPWPWPGTAPHLRLFRPLLQVTKSATAEYCRALGAGYREDSDNYSPRFTRNRLRHRLLPLLASDYNPRVKESLLRLARTASLALDYLEGEAGRLWPRVAFQEEDAVGFRQPDLASLHPALQGLLLRRAYAHLAGDTRRLGERHLKAMAELAGGRSAGGVLNLPGGLKFHRTYSHVRLSRESRFPCPFPELAGSQSLPLPSTGNPEVVLWAGPWRVTLRAEETPSDLSWKGTDGGTTPGAPSWAEHLDGASLDGPVSVRTRRPGDRFQPLGMAQDKKLQDFFTDARVPGDWRDRVPLLVSGRGIAWVVGYRIAHWARVRESKSARGGILWVKFEANERC